MEGIDTGEVVRRLLDIPVVRELSNLLHNATRPVDWGLAGQVCRAVAGAGTSSAKVGRRDQDELETACRIAELAVLGQSGLGPVRGVSQVRVVNRTEWAEQTLLAVKPMVERLAGRLASSALPEQELSPVRPVLDSVAPLVMGAQFGMTFGFLAHRALGVWDFGLPRDPTKGAGRLLFNFPNIVQLEQELQVDAKQFRMWLVLHEVTHELLFQAVDWAGPYFNGLIESYIDSARIDPTELASKFGSLTDPQALASTLQRPEDLLPMLRNGAQETVAEKIECFLSLTEGYSSWIQRRGGMSLIDTFEQIREGMSRRSAERSSPERMLEKLFGLDLSNRNRRLGEKFVGTVAGAALFEVLWRKPENLPSIEELSRPELWISRVEVA
ncbi:MAG: zinc-dependent metalloprotease [Actinomycetota bacterium]